MGRAQVSLRPAVALYRRVLGAALPAKLAAFGGWAAALICAAIVSSLESPLVVLDTAERGLGWIVWLGAGPLAWSLARRDPSAAGLAAMVALAGGGRGQALGPAQAAEWRAAFADMVARVAVPGMLVFVVGAAMVHPLLLLGVLLALLVGVAAAAVLTLTALVCRAAAERRGRTLFVAVVLLPWALGDVLGKPQLSLPGGLAALLAELTDVLSLWVPA